MQGSTPSVRHPLNSLFAPRGVALIGECVQKGVKTPLVISAGFKATGPEGVNKLVG